MAAADLKEEARRLKASRILNAATELFATHGYNGCSMDQIAQSLGVTKPFIYYHFRDKADILAAICARGAELTYDSINEAVTSSGSPGERLERFCYEFAHTVIKYSPFLTVYKREVSNLRSEDRKRIVRIRAMTDETLQNLLREGRDLGEFALLDPVITASSITGMISFISEWYRPKQGISEELVVENVVELGLRMAGCMVRRPSAHSGSHEAE